MDKILEEIGGILKENIGNVFYFNQFVTVLDKDNCPRNYNYKRNSLLNWRKKYFKGENREGKKNKKEIPMEVDKFLGYLRLLGGKGIIDIVKFKNSLVYCLKMGYVSKPL
ncbi:MAG: hypothetical protein L6Q29_02700 [Candidatus Pacebacteria bacterium]|nr:hypothetical protein [Candidatus Paceibacterota bacterium]NUQ56897.1 hypothetical protein [Candidatus Paceibacter sp.]